MEVKSEEIAFKSNLKTFWLQFHVSLETEIIPQFPLYGYVKVCINNTM